MKSSHPSREPRVGEFDLWLEHADPARLEIELRAIRARLGTASETSTDFRCCQAIAHRLNRLAILKVLRDNASLVGDPCPPRPPPT